MIDLVPSFVRSFAALWVSVLPLSAAMVTIDFDQPPIPGTQVGILSHLEDGLQFTPLPPVTPGPPYQLRINGGSNPGFPGSTGNYLQLAFGDSMRLTATDFSPFTPQAVDLAEYSDSVAVPVSITFRGWLPGGAMVSTLFVTDGVIDGPGPLDDFETFVFPPSFAGIERLEVDEITTIPGAFSLDSLVLDVVPEPSVALLAAASALVLLCRRR